MHTLISVFKQIFRLRWMNFIKIVSLALGICISAALMCKVAWERSFDSFWLDGDKLLCLETISIYGEDNSRNGPSLKCFPALAPEIVQNIASVASATRFRYREPISYYDDYYMVDNKRFPLTACIVDSSFFEVLKIRMIKGENPNEILKTRDKVIISKKTAATLFPDSDPLGQIISRNDETYTVCGIFQDLPKNCMIPNVQIIRTTDIPFTFDWGSSWTTILRTHQKPDLEKLNSEINTLLEPRYKDRVGAKISFRVSYLQDYHKSLMAKSNNILSVLALALLLISGLSFALLSINSLTSRAKEVGVRKAAGAKVSGIFSMIIWETVIYILLAAILSVIIFWGFKPQLENIIGNYDEIFVSGTLWAVALVLLLLIIVAGVIPARIFSRIPVTQVFQRFTSDRIYWKRVLLFIQFTASIFVICFMFIILRQYQVSFFRDFGYDKDKLIWTSFGIIPETQKQALMAEIMSDSRVEAVTRTSEGVWYGLSGIHISLEPNATDPFFAVELSTDSLFFKTFGVPLLYGSNGLTTQSNTSENVVVNQFLIEKLNITDNPIGQQFFTRNTPLTIAGVCGNFETVTQTLEPLVITVSESGGGNMIIRVNEITKDIIETIDEKMKQFHPDGYDSQVSTYSDKISDWFGDTRKFRDKIILTSFFLLLITIMGILGYVSLEIRRRNKEIAIRKIHGSTVIEVIWKIFRDLLLMALLSAAVAVPSAYILGSRWQQEFTVKASLSWYLFATGVFVVILTIAVCAVLQTWRTATTNPAKEIKRD